MKRFRILTGGILVAGILLVLGFFIWQSDPALKSVLAWRMDEASAFVRGGLSPRGGIPPMEAAEPRGSQGGLFQPGGVNADAGSKVSPGTSFTDAPPLPQQVVLTPPEFDLKRDFQDWNNCGPATLALALRMYGWKGDQYDIARVIKPLQTDKNVSPEEMADFVELTGLGLSSVVQVNGDARTLQQLLAAGLPVIVEQSFKLEKGFWPGDDLWSAHYLLITGYDLTKQEWITQDSYYGPNQRISMDLMEQTWKPFNRLMMVVHTRGQEKIVQSILGDDWQVETNFLNAAVRSTREVQSNPKDAFAWFNLGNSLLGLGDDAGAAEAYARARQMGLPQRMLRYEFGPLEAAFKTGNVDDLFLLANYALNRTPDSEEALTWKGWAYILSGQSDHARKSFELALEAHPDYPPALDGLTALQKP